jgi:hypothetical protein
VIQIYESVKIIELLTTVSSTRIGNSDGRDSKSEQFVPEQSIWRRHPWREVKIEGECRR